MIFRITKPRFIQLANEAAIIFNKPPTPLEDTEKIFYYPFKKSKNTNQNIASGGCFRERYYNLRGEYIKEGIISKGESDDEGRN